MPLSFEMLIDTYFLPPPVPDWVPEGGPGVKGRPRAGRGKQEPGVRRSFPDSGPWPLEQVHAKGWRELEVVGGGDARFYTTAFRVALGFMNQMDLSLSSAACTASDLWQTLS